LILFCGEVYNGTLGMKDLHRLEALEQAAPQDAYIQRQEQLLDQARALRERMALAAAGVDSVEALRQVRGAAR